MDSIPIELSPEGHYWADLILAEIEDRLDSEFDATDSLAPVNPDNQKSFWIEPEDPKWGLLLSEKLILSSVFSPKTVRNPKAKRVLEPLLVSMVKLFRSMLHQPSETLPRSDELHLTMLLMVQQAARLYCSIHHGGLLRQEGMLLQLMILSRESIGIRLAVDLLLEQPPAEWIDVSIALSPLMQYSEWRIDDVFPALLRSDKPAVLSPALDVANHAFRCRKLIAHPAAVRTESLLLLLGGIVEQLGLMEDDPSKFGSTVEQIQPILFDSVSLCVSLCDTLGLIGDQTAIGKLNQAARLGHRRIQTEACFALAKLGQEKACGTLVSLAADPACRLRAIAYATELGIEDEIAAEWTTSLAKAEAELVVWLSQHEQMGIAPHRVELLEQRTLYWPGYESPQECFLFRFEYEMGTFRYSNLGIAGPTVHAFAEDLANLPTDDAWAIFAAWDVDHPDSYEIPIGNLDVDQRNLVDEWESDLRRLGFQVVQTEFLGFFFEHKAILTQCESNSQRQIIVYDGHEITASTVAGRASPHVYLQWKGRIVLQTLNPDI